MKEIKAYIKPHQLPKVTLALHKVEGLTGMSAVEVRGFGRSKAKDSPHTFAEDLVDYVPFAKIEIVCLDHLVEEIVSVIRVTAHTGMHGDGKFYVSTINDAIRIETGERGEGARRDIERSAPPFVGLDAPTGDDGRFNKSCCSINAR